MQEIFFFFSIFSSTGRDHVGSLLTNREQKKRLAHDVVLLYTSATHADLVRDVTHTEHQIHNNKAHCLVLAAFNRRFLTSLTLNRPPKRKTALSLCLILNDFQSLSWGGGERESE